jgi:3'-phosphoadenosine 5'-phosphosulfate sulfotransferase (PAPS reductase)/FAD synthetase
MLRPVEILREIRNQTSEIILFHSLAGKDSICLLDMCSQIFDMVHCVYMHYVADLEHMNRYRYFFEKNYKNAIWYEHQHFATISYKKYGLYGSVKDETLKKTTLSAIIQKYKNELGIEWVCLGSKQSDGLSRRLQLKTYEYEAIDYKNKKVYPLSKLSNKQILEYIKLNKCIEPLNYGDNKRSQSNDITDGHFLSWCKQNFPNDLKNIFAEFPETELILFKYENKTI